MRVGRSTRPSESALPQLSLRLAKLLRLSGEGKRDGELGGPVTVADVEISSMADEEELCVSVVSTDMRVTTATVVKEGAEDSGADDSERCRFGSPASHPTLSKP
jgi:hypothetical protein